MTYLIDDVANYLENEGIGTIGTNLFVGFTPESPDACISVIDTGGSTPDQYLPTHEATFQVFIRATNYANGKAKLEAIRTALHQHTNETLASGTNYFYFVLAISEGGHLGRDEAGRDLFSINFQTRSR